MKNWIRWKGLFGFAITVLLLALFFVLFIDGIIKINIESAASRIVGAKVELDSADFHFYPLAMELGRLQVTDPQRPMRNIVEIQKVSFNLDGLNLLRRKILINEMQVDGVRFDTPRRSSGALSQAGHAAGTRASEKAKEKSGRLPDIRIPDADKILAREDLTILKQAEDLKKNIGESQKKWEAMRKKLPTKGRIDEYGKRLEKIRKINVRDIGQLASAVKELNQLERDIKADLANVDRSRKQIKQDLQKLDIQVKALKDSPQQELRRLLDKYSLSDDRLGNISELLFGNRAKKYVTIALAWYKKLEPLLAYVDIASEQPQPRQRGRGVDVRFREFNPSPDFLAREIRASIDTRAGSFSGKILNLTNEQNLIRKPLTLNFAGQNLPGIDSLHVAGTFNRIDPAEAKDRLKLSMKNYRLTEYTLLDSVDSSLSLDRAKADIRLDAQRINKNIMADFKVYIHAIEYNTRDSENELASMFLSSIRNSREFRVDASLQGTLESYTVRISSDMDERLKANMKKYMDTRLAGFRKELKEKINRQVGKSVNEVNLQYANLQSEVEKEISARRNELQKQLKSVEAEIRKKEKQATGKARDKLEKNIKGLLDKYK